MKEKASYSEGEEVDSCHLKSVKTAWRIIGIIVHNNNDEHDWSCFRISVLILEILIFPSVLSSSSALSPSLPEIAMSMCSPSFIVLECQGFPRCLARTDCCGSILCVFSKQGIPRVFVSFMEVIVCLWQSLLCCMIEALSEIRFILCFKVKVYLSSELRDRSSWDQIPLNLEEKEIESNFKIILSF